MSKGARCHSEEETGFEMGKWSNISNLPPSQAVVWPCMARPHDSLVRPRPCASASLTGALRCAGRRVSLGGPGSEWPGRPRHQAASGRAGVGLQEISGKLRSSSAPAMRLSACAAWTRTGSRCSVRAHGEVRRYPVITNDQAINIAKCTLY